jgi:hypothetical protein
MTKEGRGLHNPLVLLTVNDQSIGPSASRDCTAFDTQWVLLLVHDPSDSPPRGVVRERRDADKKVTHVDEPVICSVMSRSDRVLVLLHPSSVFYLLS